MASPRLAAEKREMSLAKNNEDRVDVFVSINTCHGYNNKAEYLFLFRPYKNKYESQGILKILEI